MSNHNHVLNFARELLGYYEIAPQHRPYHGNPGIFIGPPVDHFQIEYTPTFGSQSPRTILTQNVCRSPTDCQAKFNHTSDYSSVNLELNAVSKTGAKAFNEWLALHAVYGFNFNVDVPVLLNPIHTLAFFPYASIKLDWDTSAPGSRFSSFSGGYWNVFELASGKVVGASPTNPKGEGYGEHQFDYTSSSNANVPKTGSSSKTFAPYDVNQKQLFRSRVSLQPRTWYRLVFTKVIWIGSFNGARSRIRAQVNFSSVA